MKFKRNLWILISIILVVGAISIGLISTSSKSPNTSAQTIVLAEGAGANPNYIFPYMGSQFFSVDNINQFQSEMFRPLYWFGLAGSVTVVPSLSLAEQPVFTNDNKTVTMTMKGWKFADGQTVNAQSVMFFLNMYKADPTSFAGYNLGFGIPDQVKSATGHANTVTLNFTTSVNPGWILYNYLSEITPFADSWDRVSTTQTSSCATGLYGAATTNAACKKVETYLAGQSAQTSTYTDALWQGGADGPWRLTQFDNLGNATFEPNTKYSGPQKAQVQFVKEVAFTTTAAEQNQLQGGKVDIGYLDATTLKSPAPSAGKAGPNWSPIANTYNLIVGTPWSFNYAPINFSAPNPKSAALHQLYIRQALQESIDQAGIIKNVNKGYGLATWSPLPPNTPASISGPVANPYTFSLKNAKALLSAHGWSIENGVQTCTKPGTGATQCGAGIANGYTLNFDIIWGSGSPTLDDTFSAEIADWASIGIQFSHSTAPFDRLIGECTSAAQHYQACSWGAGWIYAPDYYPSGETLLTTKGGFNPGGYSDPKMNSLINATTFGTAKLTAYAAYAAQQIPVLYQPNPLSVNEVIKTLKSSIGFTPNPLGNFMPEYMHF